RSS
ncbi:hypothetical protein CP04DC42_0724B, partial [Chlamydia psittaci 04DC42]